MTQQDTGQDGQARARRGDETGKTDTSPAKGPSPDGDLDTPGGVNQATREERPRDDKPESDALGG